MQKLQEDYLFLVRHDIQTAAGVAVIAENMTDKKKETSREKSRIFKERAKMKPLFDMVAELGELCEMESCYQKGEVLFEKEHEKYVELLEHLKKRAILLNSWRSLSCTIRMRLQGSGKRKRQYPKRNGLQGAS